jgi:predicted amino acid-binding ACT domain protein
VHTVFQIAGPETPGLLAEVTQLLSHNGLQIRTAAAWTFNARAAIVIGVTEHNAAVQDRVKLARLQQLLTKLVETTGDNVAVSVEQVGSVAWGEQTRRPDGGRTTLHSSSRRYRKAAAGMRSCCVVDEV